MSKIKSYVKQAIARLTGDKTEELAQKNYRKATSAVRGQIAALEAQLIDAESDLEAAEDGLADAKYPKELITNQEAYLESILCAKDAVEDAQHRLKSLQASIEFNKALLEEFEKEEEN